MLSEKSDFEKCISWILKCDPKTEVRLQRLHKQIVFIKDTVSLIID